MRYDVRNTAIAAVAATMLATAPALAQDVLVASQAADELRADWIVGSTVTSTQGETIGSIQDLILSETDGRVTAAVISVGGFLGFGAKNIAVDWNELQIDWDGSEITLNLTREQADAAEEYVFRDRETAPPPAAPTPAPGVAPMTDPAPADPAPLGDPAPLDEPAPPDEPAPADEILPLDEDADAAEEETPID